MDTSHLYDDSFFGSLTIALDVKDRLQTQEINAREERTFEQWMKIYQRGQDMCKRNLACEKWRAHRSLYTIWERTPRLEKSLAAEKARVASLEKSILGRTNSEKKKRISAAIFLSDRLQTSQPEIRNEIRHPVGLKEKERPLNTDFRPQRCQHKQADFVRRSQRVVRSLARLSWRQQKRKWKQERFREELFRLSKPVIAKARVVLKGRSEMDANQYLDEVENYLLPLETAPTPRKAIYALSEDETRRDINEDFLFTRGGLSSSYSRDNYPVLPPVLAVSKGDAAEDMTEATQEHDWNNNRNAKYTENNNNQLTVGGNKEDYVERFPENRTQSGEQMQHLPATKSVRGLQKVRNNPKTLRRFILPPLKTSEASTREGHVRKQKTNNITAFINSRQEGSKISTENLSYNPSENDNKSRQATQKMKNTDTNICKPASGISNTTSVTNTRTNAAIERGKLSRSKYYVIESRSSNNNNNNSKYTGNGSGSSLHKDRSQTSNDGFVVDRGRNYCNDNISPVRNKTSDTSYYDTIATSANRNYSGKENSIFVTEKRIDICNSRISSVKNTPTIFPCHQVDKRGGVCNTSISYVKNKANDASSSNTGARRGDSSNESLPCINAKGNDTHMNHRSTNINNFVTGYQRDTISDSKTITAFISSDTEVYTHTQNCVPCIQITNDNCPQADDTTNNQDNETNVNTTAITKNRSFVDVNSNRYPARFHKNINMINNSKNINISGVSGVKHVMLHSKESLTIDLTTVAHTGPNNTDHNKNIKNATDRKKSHGKLSISSSKKLLFNFRSNNNDFTYLDSTLKEPTIDGSNTNCAYNSTTVGSDSYSSISAQTDRDSNSTPVKRMLPSNGVSTDNAGRMNALGTALTVDTEKSGWLGTFAEKLHTKNNETATMKKEDESELGNISNTEAIFDREIIHNANREIIQTIERKITQYTNTEIIQNTDGKIVHNTNREITQNTDGKIIHNTNREITHDTDGKIIHNTNREITQNTDGKIIHNTNREIIQDTNNDTRNTNREISQIINNEIIQNSKRKIIKNVNTETFRNRNLLAVRKSSNIFSPSSSLSQVISEEDEYILGVE